MITLDAMVYPLRTLWVHKIYIWARVRKEGTTIWHELQSVLFFMIFFHHCEALNCILFAWKVPNKQKITDFFD